MIPNILLVEDDHLDIINAERVLKKVNILHNLHIAKNGEEAIDMLLGRGVPKIDPIPSIIILDLNMPKLNGFEFLGILRLFEEFKDVKIFVVTTSGDELDKALCQQYAVSGYIEKPFRLDNSPSKDGFNLYIDLINLKSASAF